MYHARNLKHRYAHRNIMYANWISYIQDEMSYMELKYDVFTHQYAH